MNNKWILVPLAIVLVALIMPAAVERTERTFPISAQGSLDLKNVNGKIELNTHKRSEILVVMEKVARNKGELADVEVRFKVETNRLKAWVHRNRNATRTRVHFRVWIPVDLADVQARSTNGSLRSSGTVGDLTLESVNGSIRHDGGFRKGHFNSVNGGIEVIQQSKLQGEIQANTVNGSIQLEILKKSGFNMDAKTMNGSIRSDFSLPVSRHIVGRSMRGVVGSGKIALHLRSINGSIKILAI